jgi:protein-tyrosine phosphatase
MFLTLRSITKPADLIVESRGYKGRLYLGSVKALKQDFLKAHNIQVVVSMTRVSTVPGVLHFQFPVPDHPSANPYMQHILPQITSLIDAHIKAGHNVLVHCHAGIHRAPTVVSHYLQRYEGQTMPNSVKLIRNARPLAFYDGNTFDLKVKK